MIASNPGTIEYGLRIEGDYYNHLDIEGFSLMMKNPSYCYKFYWLEAIVNLLTGKTPTEWLLILNV